MRESVTKFAAENRLKVPPKAFELPDFDVAETNRIVEDVVRHLNGVLMPMWDRFEGLYADVEKLLNETHVCVMQANYLIDGFGEADSGAFEQILSKIDAKGQLAALQNLEKLGRALMESVGNINTKQQIGLKLSYINEQHDSLCKLIKGLHARLEELKREESVHVILVDKTKALMAEAGKLLKIDFDVTDTTRAKSLAKLVGDMEVNLKACLDKFKTLSVNDSKRVQRLCDMANEADALLRELHVRHARLMESINERKYRLQAKVSEIGSHLAFFERKRQEFHAVEVRRDRIKLREHVRILKEFCERCANLSGIDEQIGELMETKIALDESHVERNEISKLKEKVRVLMRVASQVNNTGFVQNMAELSEIFERLCEFENMFTNSETNNQEKNLQIKLLLSKFVDCRRILLHSLEGLKSESWNFVDISYMQKIFGFIEEKFNETLRDSECLSDKLHKYRVMAIKLEQELIDVEEKIFNKETLNRSKSYDCMRNGDEFDGLESQFEYYARLKTHLTHEDFKCDLEKVYKMGCDLDRQRKVNPALFARQESSKVFGSVSASVSSLELLKTFDYLPNHEALRIKYLDLVYRIDGKMKQLENEFTNWKLIAKKSARLLELIRTCHKLYAIVTSRRHAENEGRKVDLSKALNVLRRDILHRLHENEYLKEEIIGLSSKAAIKSRSIKEVVDTILNEWKLVKDKVQRKVRKLEAFSSRICDLNGDIQSLRQEIFVLEVYLSRDCFTDLCMDNYRDVLNKKCDLDELLTRLYKQDESVQKLLRQCASNSINQRLVSNLSDRWHNLKISVKEKTYEIQNLWLLICDLNEQIEKFYLILNKTESFYSNTLLTITGNDASLIRFIEELYQTIRADDKLLKYLNESYINIVKITPQFRLFRLNEKFKETVMYINSKWDDLHNKIAIKIKNTRNKVDVFSMYKISKDSFLLWLNEIDLLITNLEYLSTQELQLKFNEIQDLKSEILAQTDKLLKSEKRFYQMDSFNNLIERLKEILNRVARLDSYVSVANSHPQITRSLNVNLLETHMDDKTYKHSFKSFASLA